MLDEETLKILEQTISLLGDGIICTVFLIDEKGARMITNCPRPNVSDHFHIINDLIDTYNPDELKLSEPHSPH